MPEYDERLPPQDTDAEMSVLGCMLISMDAIGEAVETILGEDYYHPKHEEIHNVIVEMFTAGEVIDAITVTDRLRERGILNKVGGAPYIHSLTASPPITLDVTHWAKIVKDMSVRRRMADLGTRIVQRSYSMEGTVEELVDGAEEQFIKVSTQRGGADYFQVADLVEDTLGEIEDRTTRPGGLQGVPTGIIELDDLTGGLRAGQSVIIAGRPAMGKSTLAVDFCRQASIRDGMTTCIFSLEMSRTEIVTRILSAESKVSFTKLHTGELSDDDWVRVANRMEAITEAPLFIDDGANITMAEIRSKARRLVQQHDLKMLVIDYLQLMRSGLKHENRQAEVSEFSRQAKLLAKELDIVVVLLSQLNRGVEQRSDKRPHMSDLRESGSLEQDSDIILLLHRPDVYDRESTRPGEADIIVAKHRNGQMRDITVAAQLHYSRFVDIAQF